MDPSQKLLQELSNLTRNLDVLTKEIKESNKINTESQKVLSKSVEIRSDKKESTPAPSEKNTPPPKQKEGFFGKIESYFKEKSKVAEVEKFQGQPGRAVKDIVSSVAEKLIKVPKLEDGGRVTKNGVAMVGEKGPELVELQKSSTVSSNDKIMELMRMELEDSRKKKETSEASKIISSVPKLNDFVTNSYGVKVPQKEIDGIRKILEKESEGKDPDFVNEEIEAYIEGYRESPELKNSLQQAIAEVTQPKESKNLEESSKEKKVNIFEKLKSKLGGEKSPKEKKIPAEAVNQTTELTEGERIKGELKKAYEGSALGKTVAGVKSLAKKFKEVKEGKSEMKKEEQTLKSESTKATPAPPTQDKGTSGSDAPKEPSKETPSSTPATTPSSGSTTPSASKSSGSSPSKPAEPGISAQDIQDIKALLSAINTTLSGPLNVKDNKPFRPKSNMLE